jgi:hypothetical protein
MYLIMVHAFSLEKKGYWRGGKGEGKACVDQNMTVT